MALTIAIKQASSSEELSLTFDAPRIAIGRGKGCDLLLPDASVSKRHASIRQEGGRTLILDEGSVNGLLVHRVKLPPHAPRALADGEVVRVGRVWLEVRQAGGVASSPQEMRRVPLELCRRQLAAAGEPAAAHVEVIEAPEPLAAPLRLELTDTTREYVLGRGRDCDLPLPDENSSRQHAALVWQTEGWGVRDLGSKQGSFMRPGKSDSDGADEIALGEKPRPWREGELLRIGGTLCRLHDPVIQLFEETLAASEVKMRSEEYREPPPGEDETPEPPIAAPAGPHAPPPDERNHDERADDDDSDGERAHDRRVSRTSEQPSGAGLAALDTAVVLVALGLLALSLAGLFWLLR